MLKSLTCKIEALILYETQRLHLIEYTEFVKIPLKLLTTKDMETKINKYKTIGTKR